MFTFATPYPHREAAIEIVNTIDERRSKIVRNRVFDCHLSPDWRQMTTEYTVSNDFDTRSSIGKSVFDCRLPDVLPCPGRYNGEALWVQEIRHFSSRDMGYCVQFFLLPGMLDIFTSMYIGFLGKS